MKTKPNNYWSRAGVGAIMLAAAISASQAQTIITNSYTNTFDVGANTANFAGSGSVASWLYWYNVPGGNLAITNDITMDSHNNPASGSLLIDSPFGTDGTQNIFFGTFDNQWGYDFSTEAKLSYFSSISCDIHVDPTMVPFTNSTTTNFGSLELGFINSGYGYEDFGGNSSITIPLSATNGWAHLVANFDTTSSLIGTSVPGIAIGYNNYGGYPHFPMRFWIDNVQLNGTSAPPPPPPTISSKLPVPIPGLNSIGTSKTGDYRYHVSTVNSNGYGFVGQPSVTYSWNVTAFPTNSDWQQHIFIVTGNPGLYDQAADWNMTNVIFLTVHSAGPGTPATISFLYKTNEPGGNGMLFNGTDNNNHISYPVSGCPSNPIAILTDPNTPIGTWYITFANSTNVTMHSPTGYQTNFVFDPAAAALFTDPLSLCVGGQNNTTGFGQESVLSSFSATGCASPISDNFATDTTLDRKSVV